jgi:hypothetical protein
MIYDAKSRAAIRNVTAGETPPSPEQLALADFLAPIIEELLLEIVIDRLANSISQQLNEIAPPQAGSRSIAGAGREFPLDSIEI